MGEKGRESYCHVALCLCLDHLQKSKSFRIGSKLGKMVATMNITALSDNMNTQGKKLIQNMRNMSNRNASNNRNMLAIGNKVNVLNESDYQNVQAYVKKAQEIVAKCLKSPECLNKNATSAKIN